MAAEPASQPAAKPKHASGERMGSSAGPQCVVYVKAGLVGGRLIMPAGSVPAVQHKRRRARRAAQRAARASVVTATSDTWKSSFIENRRLLTAA